MAVKIAGFLAGSPQTWINTGGTFVLTLTSLANGAAREGAKASFIDYNVGSPDFIDFLLESAVGSAVTSTLLEFYLGQSNNATAGTDNPGNLTGADAGLSNPDELKLQCTRVGALVFSNARGTNVQKQKFRVWYPATYLIPLLVNKTGQSLSSTASNHKLTGTPYFRTVEA